MNVFLIESPFQLLNTIEAKEFFEFKNNHLIIILGLGHAVEEYKILINERDWDSVRYVSIRISAFRFESRFLGNRLLQIMENYWDLYRRFSNRQKLDKIAKSLSAVDNIILGNYLDAGEQYLRHLANTIEHNNLYLVDDGTDVIEVNDERKKKASRALVVEQTVPNLSLWKRVKRNVRQAFIEWNKSEADRVIFFTAYDIDVRNGDQWVKNEYCHLKKQIAHNVQSDDVFFLGQCLIEDNWINKDVYFDYLKKVRLYFAGERIFYIPHPRESHETASFAEDILGFKIKRIDVPIEYHIALKGDKPKVLASFFCSALLNCSILYPQNLRIKAFYIPPRHINRWRDFTERVYGYFSTKTNESFEVVRL